MEETIIKQQAESVKLSKMSKGYQWEIRVHIPDHRQLKKDINQKETVESMEECDKLIIERLDKINKELESRYGYKDED